MTWYEFIFAALVIALLVRLEAIFGGQYWSWLELFPDVQEESSETRRTRRRSLWRRVAIPGVVAFACAAIRPGTFTKSSCVIVGVGGAGLLLWPVVFHGLPRGVRRSDWQIPALYGGLVITFGASAWVGGTISQWGLQQPGGLTAVLKENVISLIIGVVLVGLGSTVTDVASTSASRLRQSRRR